MDQQVTLNTRRDPLSGCLYMHLQMHTPSVGKACCGREGGRSGLTLLERSVSEEGDLPSWRARDHAR